MARRARAQVVAQRDMRGMTERLVECYRAEVQRMRRRHIRGSVRGLFAFSVLVQPAAIWSASVIHPPGAVLFGLTYVLQRTARVLRSTRKIAPLPREIA